MKATDVINGTWGEVWRKFIASAGCVSVARSCAGAVVGGVKRVVYNNKK